MTARENPVSKPVAGAAAQRLGPDFPRLPLATAIRSMIHAMTASEAVASAVIAQLRQGQEP